MKLLNKKNFINNTDKNNLLEQYKTFVESADKVSDRRINVNNFFITLNSVLITVITLYYSNISLLVILSILGATFSILWFLNLKNYKRINSCKFEIIQQVEKYLPLNLYLIEWKNLKNTHKKNYIPVSNLEILLSIIFTIIYFSLIIYFFINKIQITIKIK